MTEELDFKHIARCLAVVDAEEEYLAVVDAYNEATKAARALVPGRGPQGEQIRPTHGPQGNGSN
jgi:hypothetical protein